MKPQNLMHCTQYFFPFSINYLDIHANTYCAYYNWCNPNQLLLLQTQQPALLTHSSNTLLSFEIQQQLLIQTFPHFFEILQNIYSTSAGDGDFRTSISLHKTFCIWLIQKMIDSNFFYTTAPNVSLCQRINWKQCISSKPFPLDHCAIIPESTNQTLLPML